MTIDGGGREQLKVGIVISARSDRRLLRATLQSVGQLAQSPDLVVVILPAGREHLFDQRELTNWQLPIRLLVANGPADAWSSLALRFIAPMVDLAIFASEGIVLQRHFLERTKCKFADWEDLVGLIEIVASVIKVGPDIELGAFAARSQIGDSVLGSWVRRSLRARSLMPSILALRMEACRDIKFVAFCAFSDWISYALYLDSLRPRGRTVIATAESAQELRVDAERRSGFDFGYELYDRLSRARDYVDELPRGSLLNPNIEKIKLFAEQALQYLLSPKTKRHIVTVLKGMLAARRDIKKQARILRAEIRELV